MIIIDIDGNSVVVEERRGKFIERTIPSNENHNLFQDIEFI